MPHIVARCSLPWTEKWRKGACNQCVADLYCIHVQS